MEYLFDDDEPIIERRLESKKSIGAPSPNNDKKSYGGLCNSRSESFRTLEMGVPKSEAAEVRLAWIRSQIIGGNYEVEYDSPFGKRTIVYADHTASGRSLLYIENFIINNVLPFYGNTHTCDSHVGLRTTKMVHEAGNYVKKCLGGGEEDALLFCGSGTTAAIKRLQEVMGLTVPSILRERVMKSLTNEEKWVVFVGPFEHHSNLLSWRQSLAEVVEIGLDQNGLLDMEALRLELESYKYANRPILGSFSACSNVTGIYSDTRAIAQLLHKYGGFACFDFAASGPYVEIEMRSGEMEGYDAVFVSPHKFVGGPGTPGILLMSKALYQLRTSPPSTCGGGTVAYVNGFSEEATIYNEDIEERENAGTPQIIQTIRAALAFWVKEYIGYEVIERYEHMYAEKALKRLLSNKNIQVLGNTSVKRQAILSFLVYSTTNSYSTNLKNGRQSDSREEGLYMWGETGNNRGKPLHGAFVAALLNDLFGIQARGGCACAGPYGHSLLKIDEAKAHAYRSAIKEGYAGVKPGWTRISFPYFMSNEEFEFILAALEFVATYGQRFLTLYNFDLRTGSWTARDKGILCLIKDNACNVHGRPLANSTNAAEVKSEQLKKSKNVEAKENGIVNKFELYLKTAVEIARQLPKFPPQRKLQGELDLNILSFRV
ncbi:hypothetical protein G4B88_002578 [Cannabis sativa]|uniref:Aminotransferase class V domain-containing protein n=1 Tax=Cannabis sativa TaxID=3483 RepID=A0A7J6I984_CANSA|nr:hypothetical protein G4B88_002578 [Cannabis sativa]